jgi:hypothetical protein
VNRLLLLPTSKAESPKRNIEGRYCPSATNSRRNIRRKDAKKDLENPIIIIIIIIYNLIYVNTSVLGRWEFKEGCNNWLETNL